MVCCPECGEGLMHRNSTLRCSGCSREFPVENNIPILYPDDMDGSHLEEEEKLGREMISGPEGRDKTLAQKEWKRSKREFWDYAESLTSTISDGVFINIGCGIDRGYLRLKRNGVALAGLDIVPLLLEHLKEEGIDIGIAGSVTRLPLRDNCFDSIFCIDLIHHEWEKAGVILKKFHNMLKPGGMLFLEDINAWGLGQFHKSILLPRPVHGALRKLYHRVRGSAHPPAEYEFPTSVFRIRRLLRDSGFQDIKAVPLESCPNAGRLFCRFYRLASRFARVRKYHNFHYMLSARKQLRP